MPAPQPVGRITPTTDYAKLAGCDLVKFAKISPSAAEARGALESAIRIVVTTRPVAAPLGGAALAHEAAHG